MSDLVEKRFEGFNFTPVGVEVIGRPGLDEWVPAWEWAMKAEGAAQWWIGDLLTYGKSGIGDNEISQFLDGKSYGTYSNYSWVSERLIISRRRETISFSIHAEIASIEDEKLQNALLVEAEKDQLTVKEVRAKKSILLKAGQEVDDKLDIKISAYGDHIYFNSGDALEDRWDDHIITSDTYPTLTRIGRFFHSDGTQFSLREYANVQDFPNDYKFVGTYSSIKSQIGNAVSPKMANYIGQKLSGTTFIDLFAGCGGLSCGLEQLGKKAVYANEYEKAYFQTYVVNHPNTKCVLKNIVHLETKDILDADVVVGGPPCQGFSTAGLRLSDDPRNELYKEFLRVVRDKRVKEFVMENVPQIKDIKDQVIRDFEDIGYEVDFEIVHGPDIGMKQTRTRAFFIGRLR